MSTQPPPTSERRALGVVLAFALSVRLALLLALTAILNGREFGDDFFYYRLMVERPFMLITGHGTTEMGEATIYAPLVPLELVFPGRLLSSVLGQSAGHRLGMICYDMVALGIAFRTAFHAFGAPRGTAQWAVALLLAAMPVSLGASVIWGQEDTVAAFWAAICLLLLASGRPVAAAAVAGFGLFTIKAFAVLIILGIWIGAPHAHRRIALAGAAVVTLFLLFLTTRWYYSGLFYPNYAYRALYNSASPYAAWHYLVAPLTFEQVRPVIMAVTLMAVGLVTWAGVCLGTPPAAAVVAIHAAFFAAFVGIQPEHQQWFLPFLIFLAWASYQAGGRVLPALCWGYGLLAYGYKVAYGLRGGEAAPGSGKQLVRDWFAARIGLDLYWVQMTLLLLTLAAGVTLAVLALRFRPASDPRSGITPQSPAA